MLEQVSATTTQPTAGLPPGRPGFTVTANAIAWRLVADGAAAPPSDQVRSLLAEWLRTADWPNTQSALIGKAVTEAVLALHRCRGPLPTGSSGGLRIETTTVREGRTRRLRIVVADGCGGGSAPDVTGLRELVDDVTVGPPGLPESLGTDGATPGTAITMTTHAVPQW
ncbi:hypothetical protein ACFQH9_07135 [Pseudonocardia lutea]|uniref:Anti-sigma regulatory factor (Ser/Thr protein kinase) n=1 Tax=Pseudonocardia lutea TaxID=2172015 RepID=A0ABW1I4R4_9PSEU